MLNDHGSRKALRFVPLCNGVAASSARGRSQVPSVKALVGRTVSQILKGEKLEPKYPSDLIDLIRKAVQMRKHLAANKRDTSNNHSLELVESKINRLVRYYRGKKLPAKWSYDPAQAALLVK